MKFFSKKIVLKSLLTSIVFLAVSPLLLLKTGLFEHSLTAKIQEYYGTPDVGIHRKIASIDEVTGAGGSASLSPGWIVESASILPSSHYSVWPNPHKTIQEDRILNQLSYVPKSYKSRKKPIDAEEDGRRGGMKSILVVGGLRGTPAGSQYFTRQKCPVDNCLLTEDFSRLGQADAVVWQAKTYTSEMKKKEGQVWIFQSSDSPLSTGSIAAFVDKINWTITYRPDSTISLPFDKYIKGAELARAKRGVTYYETRRPLAGKNYANGKSKLVAWFVSNCETANHRMDFVRELQRHVPVDVYGACGKHWCPRHEAARCNETLKRDYKFYLSFENANCEHYITENFYKNAIRNDVVPIVMGARKADYEAAIAPGSFIHVDDFGSPKELAQYLSQLDVDDRRYNEFFRWKEERGGNGGVVDTKLWCRVCSLLHDDKKTRTWYGDVDKWWRGAGSCTRSRWDRTDQLIEDWSVFG